MRKFFLGVAAVAVLMFSPAADAKLSVPQAHRAVDRWSVANGATWHKIQRCSRRTDLWMRCTIRESGWDGEDAGIPCDDCVAEDVWSVVGVRKHRDGRVHVRWYDFVWGN